MVNMLKCDELLVILQEECAEVSQIISKIHRYGLRGYNPLTSEYNDDLLHKEVGDLLCMVDLCIEKNILDPKLLRVEIDNKVSKLKEWSSLYE